MEQTAGLVIRRILSALPQEGHFKSGCRAGPARPQPDAPLLYKKSHPPLMLQAVVHVYQIMASCCSAGCNWLTSRAEKALRNAWRSAWCPHFELPGQANHQAASYHQSNVTSSDEASAVVSPALSSSADSKHDVAGGACLEPGRLLACNCLR